MRAVSLLALVLAGCIFGDGPQPGPPSEAKVLLVVPNAMSGGFNSCALPYMGSISIAGSTGFAVFDAYQPFNNNCNGGQQPPIQLEVTQFDTGGGNPNGMMVSNGGVGSTNNGTLPPRLTIGNNGGAWAFTTQNGQVTIGPSGAFLQNLGSFQNGQISVVGIATVGSNVFLALEASNGGGCYDDPSNPTFPGDCGGMQFSGMSGLFLVSMLPNGTGVTPTQITMQNSAGFFIDQTYDVITSNTTTTFVLTHGTMSGTSAAIQSAQTGSTTTTTVEVVPAPNDGGAVPTNVVPVGIDADDTHVVWAAALAQHQGNNPVDPGCYVWMHDLTNTTTTLLLHTQQFACMGARMENSAVYFAIVGGEPTDCNNCTPGIHGNGIGRLDLTTSPDFTSIATGVTGPNAGPRRVYVDYSGGNIYAVDPFTVASIPKSAFMNRHDFQVEPGALAH